MEGELKTSAYHVTGVWTAIKLHALALPLLLLISGGPSEKSKARECAAKPICKETEISNPQVSNSMCVPALFVHALSSSGMSWSGS